MFNYNSSLIAAKVRQAAQKLGSETAKTVGKNRLPPGQTQTPAFPVLDLGVRTPLALADFVLKVSGLVENSASFNSEELLKMPSSTLTKDFHCVTRWSRFDLTWTGVSFKYLADLVKPKSIAKHVIFSSRDGYTTNVSLEDCLHEDVLIAYRLEGADIPLLHGGPVRMVIPHLYGWKSAKFLAEIAFSDQDTPGFWETRGYHNHGDPWQEERYS